MTSTTSTINVLFVCTGNICRSPLAEQVFNHLSPSNMQATSAGVFAEVGEDMHPLSQKAMTEANFSPTKHSARQLTVELTKSADLILTATQDHSNSAAQLDPASIRKTFTVKEFARIANFLDGNPDFDQTEKLKTAISYRGYAPKSSQSEDIIDPWGRPYEIYQSVTQETQEALTQIVKWLGDK